MECEASESKINLEDINLNLDTVHSTENSFEYFQTTENSYKPPQCFNNLNFKNYIIQFQPRTYQKQSIGARNFFHIHY